MNVTVTVAKIAIEFYSSVWILLWILLLPLTQPPFSPWQYELFDICTYEHNVSIAKVYRNGSLGGLKVT